MLDRTQAPLFQGLPSFALPAATTIFTSEGVPIVGLTGVQQEVLKIDWVFDAGRWQETTAGASHFVSLLLDKGTATQPASAIAALLEGMGAHVEISAGADFFYVSLYALTKNWQQALAIVSEILSQPAFAEAELALQKKITLENIRVNQEKTSYLAGQAIRAALFGSVHPYGTSLETADVQRLQRSDLHEFHQQHFRLIKVFAAVPDVNYLDALARTIQRVQTSKTAPVVKHQAQPGVREQHISKEGSVQNSIRLGKRTIGRTHADYAALLLVNHLLGGFFGSRLMKNIREEKGLTYGIHSGLQPYLHDCSWVISADVNKANRDIAFAEIRSEMQRLCEELVSLAELDVCKNHFLGSLVADVATPFSVMEKVRTVQLSGLAANHYEKLFSEIQAITPEQFKNCANRYLSGDWHQVSVG